MKYGDILVYVNMNLKVISRNLLIVNWKGWKYMISEMIVLNKIYILILYLKIIIKYNYFN